MVVVGLQGVPTRPRFRMTAQRSRRHPGIGSSALREAPGWGQAGDKFFPAPACGLVGRHGACRFEHMRNIEQESGIRTSTRGRRTMEFRNGDEAAMGLDNGSAATLDLHAPTKAN